MPHRMYSIIHLSEIMRLSAFPTPLFYPSSQWPTASLPFPYSTCRRRQKGVESSGIKKIFSLACNYKHLYESLLTYSSLVLTEGTVLILGDLLQRRLEVLHEVPEMKLLFPKQNYNVLSSSSNTHISVRDLYISRIGLPIPLRENMWTDPGNI